MLQQARELGDEEAIGRRGSGRSMRQHGPAASTLSEQ